MAPVVDTREDPPRLARLNKRALVYALGAAGPVAGGPALRKRLAGAVSG